MIGVGVVVLFGVCNVFVVLGVLFCGVFLFVVFFVFLGG